MAERASDAVIDCDIHNAPASEAALHAYLPASWRERRAATARLDAVWESQRETLGDRSYLGSEYPRATPRAARTDAWPPNGGPPASDLPFLREQLLDRYGVEYGVLTPMLGAGRAARPRVRRRARHRHQRLADRRVARSRAAPARVDQRGLRGRGPGRGGDRPRGRRRPLRPGAAADPHRRAARPPQVLAPLRGGPGARPAGRHPLRRLGPRADHVGRLRLVLHRGHRSGWPRRSRSRSPRWCARASSSASRS